MWKAEFFELALQHLAVIMQELDYISVILYSWQQINISVLWYLFSGVLANASCISKEMQIL